MDIRSLTLCSFFGFLFTSFSTFSAETTVYRWVDKDNVVHFSQQKPLDTKITNIEAITTYNASDKKNTVAAATKKTIESLDKQSTASTGSVDTEVNQAALDSKTKENKLAKQEIFKKNCEAANANLAMLNSFKRVIYPDGNGNNKVLTPQEKADKIKESNAQIEEFCPSS